MAEHGYPINYDFGAFWYSHVVPHLNNPLMKGAIKRGIKSILWNVYDKEEDPSKYDLPFRYGVTDCWINVLENRTKFNIEDLRKHNALPEEYLKLEGLLGHRRYGSEYNLSFRLPAGQEKYGLCDPDYDYTKDPYYVEQDKYYHESDEGMENDQKLMEWQNDLYIKYHPPALEKYELETQIPQCRSHQWAPHYSFTLAKLVEPNEEWRVRVGHAHTTIINKDNTKVFDPSYWVLDGRLENYMVGTPLERDDPTRGGKLAFKSSRKHK